MNQNGNHHAPEPVVVPEPVSEIVPETVSQVAQADVGNPIAQKFCLVIQEVEQEITKIDEKVAALEQERQQGIAKLHQEREELVKLLHSYGGNKNGKEPAAKPKKVTAKKKKGPPVGSPSRKAPPGEKTIPQLIMEYMEENRKATARDIRNYLDDLGRSTNPGVELGRLVKKKKIKLVERGNYQLAK